MSESEKEDPIMSESENTEGHTIDSWKNLEDAIRNAGMDLKKVNPEHEFPWSYRIFQERHTIKEYGPPEEEKEVFEWESSLKQLNTSLHLGKPTEKKVPERKKKDWKWGPQPKGKVKKMITVNPLPPVDFCYIGLESFETEKDVAPRETIVKPKKNKDGLFLTWSARFAHNSLSSLTGFDYFMEDRFADPSKIIWLDLSYNRISEIDPVLSMLPRLRTLHLHCNCIDELDEVRKLRFLPELRILTLYGNPVEALIDYRYKVLAAIQTLKKLDLSVVTPLDQDRANQYKPLMAEKERMETAEMIKEQQAAEDRKEKKQKALEKRRLMKEKERELKQKAAAAAAAAAGLGMQPEVKEVKEEKKKEITYAKDELEEEEGEEEEELSMGVFPEVIAEEEEEEEIFKDYILPANLADPGPVDIKAKRKFYPDLLTEVRPLEIKPLSSEESLFSSDTVSEKDIRLEFEQLKAKEATVDFGT